MTLYLQANADGTFTIAEANMHRDAAFDCDYFTLEELDHDIKYTDVVKLVKEKYNCKKLVIDF